MRVHITCYGCQMNRLDAELVAEVLRRAGAEILSESAGADVLLFITCSVRRHAEDRVFSNLGALKARKRRQRDLVIGLLGCMAQAHGRAVFERAPHVDLVCAPGRLAELPALVEAARRGERPVALDPARSEGGPGAFRDADAALDRLEACRPLDPAAPGQAYVGVMRGCDNFCSYCVVPYVRGPERSRAPAAVLQEVRRLAGQGVRQVTLLGQAVNKYRWEEGGRAWDLADLLGEVAAVPGVSRVRFVTSHPRAMTPRLAAALRDVPGVCPHLHMPAQSGSDAVLERMNRGYAAAEYLERVAMVRQARPDAAVWSDFIVGFPGETPRDFEATLDLVRRLRPAGGFVFKYSPRPGTAAARFRDDVPPAEKRRRNQALLALIEQIAAEENQAFVGREVTLLVEGPSPHPHLHRQAGRRASSLQPPASSLPSPASSLPSPASSLLQLRGRTPCNRLAVFDGPPDLVGREVRVRVGQATALTLFAALDPGI